MSLNFSNWLASWNIEKFVLLRFIFRTLANFKQLYTSRKRAGKRRKTDEEIRRKEREKEEQAGKIKRRGSR